MDTPPVSQCSDMQIISERRSLMAKLDFQPPKLFSFDITRTRFHVGPPYNIGLTDIDKLVGYRRKID